MKKHLKRIFASVDPVIFLIVVVACVVRAWNFGSNPPGLNQDEASTAYDAFALLHYGIDRNGFPFPAVLTAWGSGMYPLAAWIAMPFIKLFGLSITSIRLPHLLMNFCDLVIFALLVSKMTNKYTARLATFLLAVAPWHFMAARWGHEANILPSFFLLGVYVMLYAEKKPWLLLAAFFLFELTLYSYGPAYAAVPIFLMLATITALIHRSWKLKPFLCSSTIFIIFAVPVALYVAINKYQWPSFITPFFSIPRLPSTPRIETMGNIDVTNPQFFSNLWNNLSSAGQLFLSQNDGLLWNAIPGYGVLSLFSTPFIILGFLVLCHEYFKKRKHADALMLAWCVTSICLCMLVSININRIGVALFPLVYCMTLGVVFFRKQKFVFLPVIALYLVSFVSFTWTYFTVFPAQIAPLFFDGLTEAIADAAGNPVSQVCVTGNVNMPYIYALFATKEDPHVFLHTVQYENPGAEFQSVSRYGRFTFGLDRCDPSHTDAYVIRADELTPFVNQNFLTDTYGGYIVLKKS